MIHLQLNNEIWIEWSSIKALTSITPPPPQKKWLILTFHQIHEFFLWRTLSILKFIISNNCIFNKNNQLLVKHSIHTSFRSESSKLKLGRGRHQKCDKFCIRSIDLRISDLRNVTDFLIQHDRIITQVLELDRPLLHCLKC